MLGGRGSPCVLYSLVTGAALIIILTYLSTRYEEGLPNLNGKYGKTPSQSFHDTISTQPQGPNIEEPWDDEDIPEPIGYSQKELDNADGITSAASHKAAAASTKGNPSESNNIYDSLKQYAVNNTVIMVPVNKGMLVFAENMVCSLEKIHFDPRKVVFWTLDEEVGELLRSRGLNTFHDPSLYGITEYVGFNYSSPQFGHMMKERPKFFMNVLSTGLDLLFLDTDIIFYDDPFKMVDHSVDLAIGSDSRDFFSAEHNPFKDPGSKGDKVPPVCAGTFWMKSNENTLALFQVMFLVFSGDPSVTYLRDKGLTDDQRGFDVLLNDGRANLVEPLPGGITTNMTDGKHSDNANLKVRMLDQAQVASGQLYRNRHKEYVERLAMLEESGEKKIAIHLNWNSMEKPKIEGAKELEIWQLTDEGKCT